MDFISFVPLLIAFVLLFLKVPAGVALLASSIYYFVFMDTSGHPSMSLQILITGMESAPLLAIPFFITVGVVMNYSGISKRLMAFADLLVGHLPGSLGHVNVLLSALMGGVSGSSNADCAMQCKMVVPEMERRGYPTAFSAAVTACSSIIPTIIPPGLMLVIYCMVTRASIGDLFLAGYIPGALLTIAMLITVHIIAKKKNLAATREEKASAKAILIGTKDAILALIMPFGLIFGLRMGVFTATEGGAISVLYCLIVGAFIYREIKWKHMIPIIKEAFYASGSVLFIVASAKLFGYYLTWERIPNMLSEMIMGAVDNKYVFLLFLNVFLLIIGMFIDTGPLVIILMPLLIQPLEAMGISLIHFGIMLTLNLQIGGLTPPFGSMMFITCNMTRLEIKDFVKASAPFYACVFVVLLMITFIPGITMFLPNLL